MRHGRELRAGRRLAVRAALGLLLALALAPAALAARTQRLGSPPRLPHGAVVLGALAPATVLRVTVALAPRDPAALGAFATAVSTPGSPLYHRFITVAQFARRFGAPPARIAAVRAALLADGLAVGPAAADGLSIPVRASAAALQRAFSTGLERVRLRSGHVGYTATAAPALPAALAPDVQAVIGLSALAQPQPVGLERLLGWRAAQSAGRAEPAPRVRAHAGAPHDCSAADAAASGPGYSGYTATALGQAFGLSTSWAAGDLGQGEHVAVYELEGNFPSDIAQYQACFGTAATVNYLPVDGGPPPPDASNYDGLETELDVENVIAADPQATIDVYQGNQSTASAPYDTYAAIITRDQDRVITTSWGLCEPLLGAGDARAEDTLFQEAAAQGQTVTAAAGDSGSEDCYDQNNSPQPAVDDPASQPYVTGVGGTSLSSLDPVTQAVWNDGPSGGAGGGGVSTLWGMPAYQASAPGTLGVVNADSSGVPCGAAAPGFCREVPDVSFSADPNHPYAVVWNGAWGAVGGTSGAAPYWAGLVALSAQLPVADRGCGGAQVGFLNPLLYRLGAYREQQVFDDITSGENDMLGANAGLYPAAVGYDMASGLGTFNAQTPFALCDRVTVSVAGPYRLTDGVSAAALAFGAHSSDGQPIVAWAASGLPPGVSITPAGRLAGAPAPGASGSYHVTLTALDGDGTLGSAAVALQVVPSSVSVSLSRARWRLPAWPVGIALTAGPIASARDASVAGTSFTYGAFGLPPGLRLDPADGYVSGTPRRVGRYRVTVTAGDGYGSAAQTSTWTVYARPRASRGRVSRGALSFTLTAGRYEPGGLRGFALVLGRGLRFAGAAAVRRRLSVRSGARRVGARAAVHGAELVVSFARAAAGVQVSIGAGAIRGLRPRSRLSLSALDDVAAVAVALGLR